MQKKSGSSILIISLLLHSCCPFIKEDDLGNNFRLSEYDNVDRRILYSKQSCSGSGIEIVPMTVTAYANDDKWIIAKSRKERSAARYQYWIINKDFEVDMTKDIDGAIRIIESHVAGPLDQVSFIQRLRVSKITLTLKE
jgi:hypothetical protein